MLPPAVAGIGLLAAFGATGLLGEGLRVGGDPAAVHRVGGRAGGDVRRRAALRAPGAQRVRRGGPGADGRRADARRRARADLPPGRAAARGERPARRLGARVRARGRRVRGHDHLRGQRAGPDADAHARDLRAAGERPRRRPRDLDPARGAQRGCAASPTRCSARGPAPGRSHHPPSVLRTERPAGRRRGDAGARRPLGGGQDHGAQRDRRSGDAGRRAHRVRRRRLVRRDGGRATSAGAPVGRDGLPGLRALPAPQRPRQRGVRRDGACRRPTAADAHREPRGRAPRVPVRR